MKKKKLPNLRLSQAEKAPPTKGRRSRGAEAELTFPLPPSTNKLYQKRRNGGLALSEAAKKYDRQVKRAVGDMSGFLSLQTGPEVVYQFNLTLYFEKLENPGWFERWDKTVYYTKDSKDGKHKKGEVKHRAGERKAKTRYKRIDYDNRIKFLQDKVAEAFGIDDCQIFRAVPEKRESPGNPRAVVKVRVVDRDQFFEGGPDAQV